MPTKIIERALLKDDVETYGPTGTGAIMHPVWNVHRVEFYPYASAFDVTLDLMKRTVVDRSAAMPPEFNKLSGKEVAHEIEDYKLAQAGFNAIEGGYDKDYSKISCIPLEG
jgi:NitT/TauT family transport system substrate-binding protein